MEPRLESLIKLWSDSLERDLSQQAAAELEALLEDPALVESFGQWQAERSPNEGGDPGPTPELDRRVRGSFNGKGWAVRHWPQLLAAAAAVAGLAVFINALLPRKPDVMAVSVDDRPLAVTNAADSNQPEPEILPAATARPTLGLPPGFGERPTRLEAKISGRVELRWTMPADGQAEVRVLDSRGRLVRTVWKGHADEGRYRNHWNGKDEAGTLVAPGAYRLQARGDGQVLGEQKVELSAAE